MSKICFVSYEIHPTVQGGCGVLLYNAARLLLAQGHEIIFLLDLADEFFHQFNEVDRLNLPNPGNCRAYQVQALAAGSKHTSDHFKSTFQYQAYRFHLAASEVYRLESPDIIEFFEYCGVAYHALCAKVAGCDYRNTHLALRLHNSMESIDRHQPGNFHSLDRYIMYDLEHHVLRLAETVLYPSKSYLDKAYKPYYEPWFGNVLFSKPPLVDRLEAAGPRDNPEIILFYSRLVGFKGVDRFIDAAVLYLNDPGNPRRQFYLVGYDSYLSPDEKGSYQKYLRCKIPPQFQDCFHFTGHMSWQELGRLLPRVMFAVVSSYHESFCYAAHELYEAGVPLIVSKIPAFDDYFLHEKNALVFDGTVSDLAYQMRRLSTENELRQRITRPYSLIQDPLGDFYGERPRSSWIKEDGIEAISSLLICILCDKPGGDDKTLQSLKYILSNRVRAIVLRPAQENGRERVVAWFLGKLYSFEDGQGESLYPTEIITSDALLILKEGDTLDTRFISIGLSTLQRQSQISFVGSWKLLRRDNQTRIETLAIDAAPELMPFVGASTYSRYILRTSPGKLLIDLFDSRAGGLGEMAYLWQLDTGTTCGIVIPEPLVIQSEGDEEILDTNTLDYLLIRDDQIWRKRRLTRYLLSLADRPEILRKHTQAEGLNLKISVLDRLKPWVYWLGSSRLSRWMNRAPRIKRTIRKLAEVLRLLEPRVD